MREGSDARPIQPEQSERHEQQENGRGSDRQNGLFKQQGEIETVTAGRSNDRAEYIVGAKGARRYWICTVGCHANNIWVAVLAKRPGKQVGAAAKTTPQT